MNTNFFLTIIIGIIFWAAICFLFYLTSRWVILKFQSFIKGMINKLDEETEPDETSACVHHKMNDRAYNEMLMRELRNDAIKAKTIKGETVAFSVSDGPLSVKDDEIIFMQ